MSNYKRKEVFDYLTRKPVTTQDIELARSRIQTPVPSQQMPVASNEDLGFATGGVVSREAFKYGTSKAFKEFLEKQISKNKTVYNSLDELINKSNIDINQPNAIKMLKNEYPDIFKIKVQDEYFPIHEDPKVALKAIEGFKKLKEWEKNPTAENWFSVFRVTEPSGKIKPSKFSQGLRNYIQGKEGEGSIFNKYFDKIELDEKLYNEIKTYDKNLANTLKAKQGSQAARKAILEKSDQAINDINEQFKFDPNSSLEEITESLYGNQFKNADKKTKLVLATQTSDDVLKYLKLLQGARPEQAKKIKLPDQETINDIVDNIAAGKKGGFRFQEGTLRQYKFDIRDTLLGLKAGTSSQLRSKVLFGEKRVIDESVGLSATYELAPGYTEASQFLSKDTNRIKGQVIDRPFKRALDKALDGDLSEVKEYNKIARQFKKEYPDVDVPIIEIGKNPKDVIKYFDSFSKESQKNILDIYNKSNISIKTNSRPLSLLVDEYQKADKLEGKAKTAAFTALGLTSAGVASADEVSDLTPMEASVLPELSKIKEVVQENPITSGALAITAPLATEKGRDIYAKAAKGLGKGLSIAGTPLGVATYEALGPGGLRDVVQEGKSMEEIATDPFTYASLPFANIASQTVSNPTLQRILSLGLPLRAVGALTPIGLTAMGATTLYQGIKSLKEEAERRSLLTPEQREQEDMEREEQRGRLAETGQFATGGRVKFAEGSDNPESDLYIPPLETPETKKDGVEGLYFDLKKEQRMVPLDETGKPITSGGIRELKKVFSSMLYDSKPEIGYGTEKFNISASKGINPFQGDRDIRYQATYTPEGDVGKFMIGKTPQALGAGYSYQKDGLDLGITGLKDQMGDKSIMLRFGYNYNNGGRVGFSSGGIKLARLISEALLDLKNNIHMVGNTARFKGAKEAKLEALTPYKNVPDQSRHTSILESINKAKQNLPKEYQSILDDIKKDVDNFDYATADNRIMALDKEVNPTIRFEGLSKDLFPMEDPLNNAIIILDPNRDRMIGRFVNRVRVDTKTGRGIRETYDTFDSESRKFLDEKDWKLMGVESLEKGKEGLN